MTGAPTTRRTLVVASAAVVSFVVGGACSVAVSLFIHPLLAEFHWPNSITSGIATAFTLSCLASAPAAGALVNKFGARHLMTAGVLVTAAGFLWARFADTVLGMYWAFVLAGIGNCAAFYVPVSVVTTNWMGPRKSLGMGIVLGATSAGAAVSSIIISWAIQHYGWRLPLVAIAIVIAAMAPLIVLTIETAPTPAVPSSATTGAGAATLLPETELSDRTTPDIGRSGRASLLSPAFMVATGTGALFNVGMASIYYHIVSVLVAAGYSTYTSGMVLGTTWILSALGSLVLGGVADRRGAESVLTGALLCCALGTAVLRGASDSYLGTASVLGFVLLWGSTANSVSQFLPVIFAERFGPNHLGMLLGVQSGIAGIASAAAPVATGWLYDRSNSYHGAIYFSACATLLAAVLMGVLLAWKSNDKALVPRLLPK